MATQEESYKVWIEDGILYNEYHGKISIDMVLEVEKKSVELITREKIQLIPSIVTFDVKDEEFQLSTPSWGKIVSGFKLLNYLSCIVVINASEGIKKILSIPDRVFLKNKIKYADSIEEARVIARKAYEDKESLI